MKKLYTGLLISLMTYTLNAQSFIHETGTPFADIMGQVAFADIDNDNDLDVLIGSELFTNDGEGVFEGGTFIPINAFEIYSIAFADVDNDNDQDVMISWMNPETKNSEESNLHTKLFNNDGNGSFSESTIFEFSAFKCGSIAFADVDNDSDPDVLITGFTYNMNSSSLLPGTILYINDGSGLFSESAENSFVDIGFSDIAFADVDNDNDQDVLISGFDGTIAVSLLYINDGSGVFTESTGNSFAGVGDCSNVFGDIDNDNDLDLLITGWSGTVGLSYTELYTNNGYGQFTQVTNTPFVVVGASAAAFSDVDNDNDLDVLITGYNGIKTHAELYANDGYGDFELLDDTPFLSAAKSSLAFADIDNDGDQDVLISGFADWNYGYPQYPQSILYRNITSTTGLPKVNPLFNSVSIYPNPNQGQVSIDLGELKDLSIKVYSLEGQLIYFKENIIDLRHQIKFDASPGLYILELSKGQEKQQYKLIKE